jgi:hypothetical protein
MKGFFGDRLVRGVLAVIGLTTTVGGPVPAHPPAISAFVSNGCSVFPENDTYACCYMHDMAYWQGGTLSERRRADLALHQCVVDVTGGNYVESGLIYAAVSIFGLPGIPTRVQWGYGWGDSRQTSYNALTPAEHALAESRKQDLCHGFTAGPDPDKYLVDSKHWIRATDARPLCPSLAPGGARQK